MINLKPCPFCGSEVQDDPHTGEKYPRKSPMGGWIIHCECCGASLSQFRKSGKGEISWNTRPIEDALQSRIAELEKDLSNKEIEYTDLWDDALALQARIAELEAENEKINYFFRRLRMFCIFAHWDNPNTEAEFYKVDAEIREYLSEYKVCIDQLTAHDAIERQDDKWIPEVQE